MKIKDLIARLIEIEKQVGNNEVYLSCDNEGNSYGSIDKGHSFAFGGELVNSVVIYPYEENIELSDMEK